MENNIQTGKQNEVQNYFDSLPEYLRENIKQSNVKFDNVDDLKKYAQNMMKNM